MDKIVKKIKIHKFKERNVLSIQYTRILTYKRKIFNIKLHKMIIKFLYKKEMEFHRSMLIRLLNNSKVKFYENCRINC